MKPIIFSTPMVQAILEGRKTMTRRVMKPLPMLHKDGTYFYRGCFDLRHHKDVVIQDYSPYKPGDILWVRETFQESQKDEKGNCIIVFCPADEDITCGDVGCIFGDRKYLYRADEYYEQPYGNNVSIYDNLKWRPSIYMPKEAARIFLQVKDVRGEQVQDISIQDAKAEGVSILDHTMRGGYSDDDSPHYKESFAELWDRINAKKGYDWEINPFVWVIEFERMENL